ncbi:MAG: hypothetical protein ACRDV9_05305 [Acidimicrobiia bacterium]
MKRFVWMASALALAAPLVAAEAGGASPTIPIGPGSNFTILSKATTHDALDLEVSDPVEIAFSEVRIDSGGTTGRLARAGTVVVNVDEGDATLVVASGEAKNSGDCDTRTVVAGAAAVQSGGTLGEIRNNGSAPLTLHLTTLTPVGTLTATTAPASCTATAPKGTTAKVLSRSTTTVPVSAQASGTTDVYVGIVRADPARSAGPWHVHPGPLFVAVDQGELTMKVAHDGRCDVLQGSSGVGFLETPGMVHEASNQGAQPLTFYLLGFAPSPQPLLTPRPTPAECENA